MQQANPMPKADNYLYNEGTRSNEPSCSSKFKNLTDIVQKTITVSLDQTLAGVRKLNLWKAVVPIGVR